MYGDQNKPKLEEYRDHEQLILNKLSPLDEATFGEVKKELLSYKAKIMEKKDYSTDGKLREMVIAIENKLINEKKADANSYVLVWLLRNILLKNSPFPDIREKKNWKFDEDGFLDEIIKKEIQSTENN